MSNPKSIVHEKAYPVAASVPRTFNLLTEPQHMCVWLAEQVDVDLRVGGAYRFWGRHTPWCADATVADQRITEVEAPQMLGFSWTWRRSPGQVALRLAAAEHGTSLTVRHETRADIWFEQDMAVCLLGDLWRVLVGNLQSYARTGRPALQPDFTREKGDVCLSIFVDAPPAAVFKALTDPQLMNQWLSTAGQAELRPGGKYSYGWTFKRGDADVTCGPTRLLAVEQDRMLLHDWGYADEPPTQVRWELTPEGGGTRVTLTHVRPDRGDTWSGYQLGWSGFLVALREFGGAVLRG